VTKLEKGAVLAEGTFRHSSFVIRIPSFCIALPAASATTGH